MTDWSMLPHDLLGEVALRLDTIQDFIFFSVVCRSWHQAHTMVKVVGCLRMRIARMPWLLLPESTEDNPDHYRNLYCPSNRRCYRLKLPEAFEATCWGSSCGWVVTLDLNLDIYLFNPFTRARVALPPQSTMPLRDEFIGADPNWVRQYYVDRMLVFNYDNELIVMALHGCYYGDLAYARPGDKAWTPLLTSEINKDNRLPCGRARAHDVVKRGSQFFFLFYNGVLGHCDVSALEDYSQPPMVTEYLPPPLEILKELFKGSYKTYLLDSFGDLLMVLRYKEIFEDQNNPGEWDKDSAFETIGFEVYKLNFGTKTWEEVNDLGDVALFTGNNFSMSVRASNVDNFKRNCIYFTDDDWEYWNKPKGGGHDNGVFDMKKEEVEKVYEGDEVHSDFCVPVWFIPKFF